MISNNDFLSFRQNLTTYTAAENLFWTGNEIYHIVLHEWYEKILLLTYYCMLFQFKKDNRCYVRRKASISVWIWRGDKMSVKKTNLIVCYNR
jgi:hypothetical protein